MKGLHLASVAVLLCGVCLFANMTPTSAFRSHGSFSFRKPLQTEMQENSTCCNTWDEPCTPGPEEDESLPLYVLTLGVEGSGHHAFHSVFKNLQSTGRRSYGSSPPVKVHAIEAHLKLHGFEYPTKKYNPIDGEKWFNKYFLKYLPAAVPGYGTAAQPEVVTDDAESFPMMMLPLTISYPDILFWLRYVDGKYFRLRFIVLYRNPAFSPMSVMRRFNHHHPRDHTVRMHEHGFIYINSLIPRLPCDRTMFVRSEDFTSDPEQFAEPLHRLIPKLTTERLRHVLRTVIKRKDQAAHEEKYKSDPDYQMITTFYEEREQLLWPRLVEGPRPYGILTSDNKDGI